MAGDRQACPKCGGTEIRPAGALRHHFNVWIFLLGGWLLSLLWSVSRKEEVQCVQCESIFQRATRASIVARILLVLFILLVLLGFWATLAHQPGVGDR
jgi:hypothetical protein